jgi:hypothetical protein
MTRAIQSSWVRTAFMVVVLALAALAMRPLVVPLAAQIWTSPAAVTDRGDDASQGVLPSKTVLRLASKLRHDYPSLDPPSLVLVALAVLLPSVRPARLEPRGEGAVLLPAERPLDHPPRGPPRAVSQPNASPERA